jgi:hypothetical protein
MPITSGMASHSYGLLSTLHVLDYVWTHGGDVPILLDPTLGLWEYDGMAIPPTASRESIPTCHAVEYATTLFASTHDHAMSEYEDTPTLHIQRTE